MSALTALWHYGAMIELCRPNNEHHVLMALTAMKMARRHVVETTFPLLQFWFANFFESGSTKAVLIQDGYPEQARNG